MKKRLLSLIIIISLVTSTIFPMNHAEAGSQSSYEQLLANTFTTTSTNWVDGKGKSRTYYHDNVYKNRKLFKGIDVSWHQSKNHIDSDINWTKAHQDGIDFAFVRIAARSISKAGTLFEDTSANSHITQALANDINVGVYIFSQAITVKEAREEAEYVLDILERNNWKITLPVIFDYEYSGSSAGRFQSNTISKAKKTEICETFCDLIREAGYEVALYSGYYMMKSDLNGEALAKKYPIWFARYNICTTSYSSSKTTNVPYSDLPFRYDFWQFSSTGKVSGYGSNLDMNYWYMDNNVKTSNLRAADITENSYTLKWNSAGNAKNYSIYKYNEETDSYDWIRYTTKRSYTLEELNPGTIDQYKVRCYWTIGGKKVFGKYSDVLSVMTTPEAPAELMVSNVTPSKITLDFQPVEQADGYIILRSQDPDDIWEEVATIDDPTLTTYTDSNLDSATEYHYAIRTYKIHQDEKVYSHKSDIVSTLTRPDKSKFISVSPLGVNKMELTFEKVSKANGYKIYRYDSLTEKWGLLTTIEGNENHQYVDEGLKSATAYQYRIRPYMNYNDTKVYGYYSDAVTNLTKPLRVSELKMKSHGKTTITLQWNPVARANGYQIYRYNSATKKWKKLATLTDGTTTTYKDTKLTSKTSYDYKVRAYVLQGEVYTYGLSSTVITCNTK